MTLLTRRLLPIVLLLAGFGWIAPAARAQDEIPVEGESKGEPLYGYVGTAFLAAGALFVLCKTARR
jgi:hypothetical protein